MNSILLSVLGFALSIVAYEADLSEAKLCALFVSLMMCVVGSRICAAIEDSNNAN